MTDVSLCILPYLSIKDLMVLRCASRELVGLVDGLFQYVRRLSLSSGSQSEFLDLLLPKCHRLYSINLRGSVPIDNDLLYQVLDNNCNTLREISLTDLSAMNLSAAAVQPILLDKCHRLETLKITKCHWLTDGALECFLLHLNRKSEHNLRHLDLSGCNDISARVLNLLVRSQCLHLVTVNLSNLPYGVLDETLKNISTHTMSATIENLNLINCRKVTAIGLRWEMVIQQIKHHHYNLHFPTAS